MTKRTRQVRTIPLWAGVLSIVLVAVACVGGTFFFTRNSGSEAGRADSKPTRSSEAPKVAEACFGGSDSGSAVVRARETLPLTDEGAATFAATFSRWVTDVPFDPDMDSKVEQLFERGWENGWAHVLPSRQKIDPEIVSRRTDTSTATYWVYGGKEIGPATVWAVFMKRDVVTEYSDGRSETVTITDAFLVQPDDGGQWQYSTSLDEKAMGEVPGIFNEGREAPVIAYSNPCPADV